MTIVEYIAERDPMVPDWQNYCAHACRDGDKHAFVCFWCGNCDSGIRMDGHLESCVWRICHQQVAVLTPDQARDRLR